MREKHRKTHREKDLTSRYVSGDWDEDHVAQEQRFSQRSKDAQQNKILRTAVLRAHDQAELTDPESLPIGQIIRVFSLFCELEYAGRLYLSVVRKTLVKVTDTPVIVGDRVRFRDTGICDENGRPEAVIEQILPRETLLTRAASFKAIKQDPIVANAQRMLIVVSLREPRVKWGLVDRMIVAAQSGKLEPIVCLNKIDLAGTDEGGSEESALANEVLSHYGALEILTLRTSVTRQMGLDALRDLLRDRVTVLAGHSGVGKSSLIRAIQPALDLRIAQVSQFTDKGVHTTTTARHYDLDFGGAVIDTPGVKMFGLWGVTAENLPEYFPDMVNGTAPTWRRESYERILSSLPKQAR